MSNEKGVELGRCGGTKVLYPSNEEGDCSYKRKIYWEVCFSMITSSNAQEN
jgi:hypothetical protein